MLKFVKGDAVKFVDPQSTLVALLRHEGWKVEGGKEVVAPKEEAVADDTPRRGRPPKEKEAAE